jgi:tetratricopeptide (TPR) repeat protein
LVLIFKSAKKEAWKPVAFGLSWFLLMLLPTSSIIPFSEVTNDHRLFLPALGLVVACVCSLKNLWPLIRAKNLQTLSMAMIGLVLCGYAYGTHVRNEVWKNEKNLWQDVTEKSPRNGRAWMNYALVFMAEAKYKEAVAALLKAQALVPYYPNLYINLAIVQGETGRDPEARQNFLKAIQLNMPGELDPYYFYARYLSQRGHPEEAEGFVKQALQIFSGHLLSRQLLMEIYLQEKRKPELLNLTQETLALYPHDTESLRYLGLAKKEN